MEGEQGKFDPDKKAPKEIITVCAWCHREIGDDKKGERIAYSNTRSANRRREEKA